MAAAGSAMLLAACQPKVVEVEKVVKETVEVEKVIKETVVVETEKEKIIKETVAVPTERSKVVFWHAFGSGASRDHMDQFTSRYNIESSTYVAEPIFVDLWTLDQKFTAAIAAGQPPDAVTYTIGASGLRAEAQQIMSLSPYIAADGFDVAGLVPYAAEALEYKGEIWGLPFQPDTRVLYYNKGQFAEAGLDPETPPETWDDLWEFALKVDQIDASGSLQRVGFSPMFGNVYVFPFLFANGAVPVSDAGEFNFQSPEIIETAYWYKQWADHYGHEELLMFASGFGTEANDPFMSGLLSMIVQNNRYIGDLIKYAPATEWGVGMIPHTGTPASQGAGYDLEVPKGASNPDGAWDLIKAGMSREVQVGGAKLAGWLPSVMANAEDPSLADIPFWDVVVASAKVTQGRKFVLEAPSWFAFVVTAFEEVWDGLKTPEQALADAQAAAEKEVENYHAARQ